MSNFGDQSLQLLQAQSAQLAKGDLVRVKQSNGDWTIFKVYSRHRQQWYNVSTFDDDSPSHSLKLVPKGGGILSLTLLTEDRSWRVMT